MNRVKKEFKAKGIKLENDYPYLPFYIKGKSCFDPGNICIESVIVNSENASVFIATNVMCEQIKMDRSGKLKSIIE